MILLSQDEFMKSDESFGSFMHLKMANLPGDVAQRLDFKLSIDAGREEWFWRLMLRFFNLYGQHQLLHPACSCFCVVPFNLFFNLELRN